MDNIWFEVNFMICIKLTCFIELSNIVQEWLSNSSQNHLELPPVNSYFRLISHQEIPKRFPGVYTETVSLQSGSRVVGVYRTTAEDKQKKDTEDLEKAQVRK